MNISKTEKYYIYSRDNKSCFYCEKPLKFHQITLDHLFPKSHGGTTDVFNLVACCKSCNKLKGSKIPKDYEDTILDLLIKAVSADMIRGAALKIKHNDLKDELLKIDRIEDLTEYYIFQSRNKRFYIRNNKVIQITNLSCNKENPEQL